MSAEQAQDLTDHRADTFTPFSARRKVRPSYRRDAMIRVYAGDEARSICLNSARAHCFNPSVELVLSEGDEAFDFSQLMPRFCSSSDGPSAFESALASCGSVVCENALVYADSAWAPGGYAHLYLASVFKHTHVRRFMIQFADVWTQRNVTTCGNDNELGAVCSNIGAALRHAFACRGAASGNAQPALPSQSPHTPEEVDLVFYSGVRIRSAMEHHLKTDSRVAHIAWWQRTFGEPLRGMRVTIRHRCCEHAPVSSADGHRRYEYVAENRYVADVVARALSGSIVQISVECHDTVSGYAKEPRFDVAPVGDMRAALPCIERFSMLSDARDHVSLHRAKVYTACYNVLRERARDLLM